MLSDVISYFRACYQADNRALHLSNFFSGKTENHLLLSEADLISGSLPKVSVDPDWATDTQKNLRIYTKEKALFCCSLFMLGHISVAEKPRKLCAPLYLHPAQLVEKEGEFYVSINVDQPIINQAAIPSSGTEAYDKLVEQLPMGFIDFGFCGEVQRLLHEVLPHLDTQELLLFPSLHNKSAINRCYRKLPSPESCSLVPASGLCVVRKSTTTLGVLSELKEIAQTDAWSPPLRTLFSFPTSSKPLPPTAPWVPVTLSQAQEKVFQSSNAHHQTLVIGPPGTGKSFTIAALAVDYLGRGKSVLIASSNNQAVDVIADKIEKDFDLPDVVVRGGRQDYKKLLKKRLQAILSGVGVEQVSLETLRQCQEKANSLSRNVHRLEKKITQRERAELQRGAWLAQQKTSWLTRWREAYVRWRIAKTDSYYALLAELEDARQQREQIIRKYLVLKFHDQLAVTLHTHRSELQSFLQALRARTAQRKESLFESTNLRRLQRAFPIWLSSLSDVSSVLPLEKELFDLVIIDEATQCDIASTLPVLQRGKRAIVVGDPQQLRHVSFLSQARQRHLQNEYKLTEKEYGTLDFRERSLLDKVQESVQDQSQIIFLDEHYRSAPSIISFSNQAFYRGALRIMTATPHTNRQQKVIVHRCEGERTKAGYNRTEADAILQQVDRLIREEALQEAVTCQSIGILSPFREQVDYLQKQIQKTYPLDIIDRHQLLIGTAHSFQGEERDVMFISLTLGTEDHPAAFRYLNQPDVFNVSITRARSQQHVFTSLDASQLKPDLVRRYLEAISQARTPVLPQKIKDAFLDEITEAVKELGITEIHRAYPIAGIEIDLLVTHAQHTYCIDAVGYPGDFAESFSIERYKILHRVGLTTFPVAYSSWRLQRAQTVSELTSFLGIN